MLLLQPRAQLRDLLCGLADLRADLLVIQPQLPAPVIEGEQRIALKGLEDLGRWRAGRLTHGLVRSYVHGGAPFGEGKEGARVRASLHDSAAAFSGQQPQQQPHPLGRRPQGPRKSDATRNRSVVRAWQKENRRLGFDPENGGFLGCDHCPKWQGHEWNIARAMPAVKRFNERCRNESAVTNMANVRDLSQTGSSLKASKPQAWAGARDASLAFSSVSLSQDL